MVLLLLIFSLTAIAIYRDKLRRSLSNTPQLHSSDRDFNSDESDFPKVSVIIPAYNEAENIQDCVKAVLESTQLSEAKLEVWVVDDQSTDETLSIIKGLQQQLNDPRLKVLAGQPRPQGETWVGKNWACTQAVQQVSGEFLLFIDADVKLKPRAIETAIQEVHQDRIDLLSLAPAIICGCLAEWLVQPLMVNNLAVGFDFGAVNDPKSDRAFAVGPFMLFRRSAYEQVGGHQAVASQVVEDVELARRIKGAGLKLRLLLGSELVSVRMYRSWRSLWEGWTKNLYLGSQRDLLRTLNFALSMIIIYPLPLLCLAVPIYDYFIDAWGMLDYLSLALAVLAIGLQYDIRRIGGKNSQTPPRYWWLSGVGGFLIAVMAIASVIKTETGWGWTWRGRSLKLPEMNEL